MVTADDVRRVGLALPRAYERLIGAHWKLKVRQIVFTAFAQDELDPRDPRCGDVVSMGFGFPKAERDGLIESDPETFFLPPARDLRYQWVCARLDRLDQDEMRELVTDAWRMCTPAMLHDLPDMPAPTAAAWAAMDTGEWGELRPLLHPRMQFDDRSTSLRGRSSVLRHLRESPTPKPAISVEIRDGKVYRWVR